MPKEKNTIPAQGEINAIKGYMKQYEYSACEVYRLMHDARLDFISIADASAGILDDLVYVSEKEVHATQIKTETDVSSVALHTQLINNNLIVDLATSWQRLKAAYGSKAHLRYVFGGFFSSSDKALGNDGAKGQVHSSRFAEFINQPALDAEAIARSPWSEKFKELQKRSGLSDAEFLIFVNSLTLLDCRELERNKIEHFPRSERSRVEEILDLLPKLVANAKIGDRWTEDELVKKLGWSIKLSHRRLHEFPVPGDVQENVTTQERLYAAIREHTSGYISLLGPPGTGKSTLLQRALFSSPDYVVARYLAFVPDQRHALGRAEAGEFLNDLTGALNNLGFSGSRFQSDSLLGLRNELARQLEEASTRYRSKGQKTVLVIDGLDHVPREETPSASFLREMPLATTVPEGVLIVLGSQHLDLADLNPSARQQALREERRVDIDPLPRSAIFAMAEAAEVPNFVDRDALYQATAGHPLTARYFIEALRDAPERAAADRILSFTDGLGRALEEIYERVWNALNAGKNAKRVLALLARAEGEISVQSLADSVSEDAVDDVLATAKFLLTCTDEGYLSIFHNSFRLFIGQRTNKRLGQLDTEIEKELNRELAKIASQSPERDPQHWMELRYLARAQDYEAVLAIGTADYFRKSLKAYRPREEIFTDLRLVYRAVRPTRNRTLLLNKLFIEKELDYRLEAISQVDFVDVFMALGERDIAAKHALSGDSPKAWHDLVDELWDDNQKMLARRIFEANEPLEVLFATNGFDARDHLEEARKWIQRAHRFRPLESLVALVEALPIDDHISFGGWGDEKAIREALLFSLAQGVVADAPETDVGELEDYLGLGDAYRQMLRIDIAENFLQAENFEACKRVLEGASSMAPVNELHISWRMAAAFVSFRVGLREIAESFLQGLTIPPINRKGDATYSDDFSEACRTRYRLCALASMLGLELESENSSDDDPFFAALEAKLDQLSKIRGRIEEGDKSSVLADLRSIVSFLAQAKAEPLNRYLFEPVLSWLSKVFADIAAQLDGTESEQVVSLLDRATKQGRNNLAGSESFRRTFALELYNKTGDSKGALARLQAVQSLSGHERTPQEAVDSKIEQAKALAHIDETAKAWDLLASIHEDTFGYFLRAKKEPQYEFWADVFRRACDEAPENAGAYGKVFGRFLLGMDETEGYETARRVIDDLLLGVATSPSALAGLLPRLMSSDLTTWPRMVSTILAGIAKNEPNLASSCAIAFSRLVVPFYDAECSRYVDAGLSTMSALDRAYAIELLASDTMKWCPPSQRPALLHDLLKAAPERAELLQPLLDIAQKRLVEIKPVRESTSPDTDQGLSIDIEGAQTFDDLMAYGDGKGSYGDRVDYSYARAAEKIARSASRSEIEAFVAARPHVMDDAKFVIACSRAMLRAGEEAFSDKLFEQAQEAAQIGHWSWFLGGQKIELQELRVEREGDIARDVGFDLLVDELASGQTAGTSLFLNLQRVMELICKDVPYVEFWKETEAHLQQYREYQFAEPLSDSDCVTSHADLLAYLLAQAFGLLCSELLQHARVAALEIGRGQAGSAVLPPLLTTLEDESNGIRESATLCFRLREITSIRETIIEAAKKHALHADFVVAHQGQSTLAELGIEIPKTETQELPGFYALQTDDGDLADNFEFAPGTEQGNRLWADDPWSWTAGLGFPFRMISDGSGIDLGLLRRRCAELMRREGGREAFGPEAEERSVERLKKMDLKMPYRRLLPMAAHRALGRVVGEIVRARHLDPRILPLIWSEIGGPTLSGWELPVEPVPDWLLVPKSPDRDRYGVEVEEWLDTTNEALHTPLPGEKFVLGELSVFRYRIWREMAQSIQLCLPDTLEIAKVDEYLCGVPSVVSMDTWTAAYRRENSAILCRVYDYYFGDLPEPTLTLCPHLVSQLGWVHSTTNPFDIVDQDGQVMVTTLRWVDGTDQQDTYDREAFGYGHLVLATSAARAAIEAEVGPISLGVKVQRLINREGNKRDELECIITGSGEMSETRDVQQLS